jgi:hypothetical protein
MQRIDLDIKNDVLYIRTNERVGDYGENISNTIVIFRELDTEDITEITVFDFIKSLRSGGKEVEITVKD